MGAGLASIVEDLYQIAILDAAFQSILPIEENLRLIVL
ncbi:MAG: hypothetical protein ACD_75C00938G0001 [uncultured bacterium]|nr:MAG: hypothetical protein ACD_75C00938G0001 [uncultured bacterium]